MPCHARTRAGEVINRTCVDLCTSHFTRTLGSCRNKEQVWAGNWQAIRSNLRMQGLALCSLLRMEGTGAKVCGRYVHRVGEWELDASGWPVRLPQAGHARKHLNTSQLELPSPVWLKVPEGTPSDLSQGCTEAYMIQAATVCYPVTALRQIPAAAVTRDGVCMLT